jgi:heat shock protein 90kDa beta
MSAEAENESESDKTDEGISDDEEDADSDKKKADKPKEKRFETVLDWEHLNGNKALWLRNSKEVEDEEYNKFFSALNKVCVMSEAKHRLHFKHS